MSSSVISCAMRPEDVVALGPRIDGLPMFVDEPSDISEPLREAGDIAIEDRELGHEREQANVERALEQLLRRLQRGRKIDRGAIEGVIAGGKQPLRGRHEIHELRVAFEIEIGPAWISPPRRAAARRDSAPSGEAVAGWGGASAGAADAGSSEGSGGKGSSGAAASGGIEGSAGVSASTGFGRFNWRG